MIHIVLTCLDCHLLSLSMSQAIRSHLVESSVEGRAGVDVQGLGDLEA